jgi:hypothetical protein
VASAQGDGLPPVLIMPPYVALFSPACCNRKPRRGERHIRNSATLRSKWAQAHLLREICTVGSVRGEAPPLGHGEAYPGTKLETADTAKAEPTAQDGVSSTRNALPCR